MSLVRYSPRDMGILALLLVAALSATMLAGCGPRETRTSTGTRDRILHVGNGAEPEELDPHLVTGVPEHHILSALFEGLVNLDPATLEPTPGAAESWTISEDGKVYTFRLRENLRWSDGKPLVAGHFIDSWRRILTPALGSRYASMLYCVRNARAFNEGTIEDFSQVGARAIDDRTIEVTLENPTPYFLSLHIHYSWYPVPMELIEKLGGMTARDTKWTQPENMVCNGPFKLERWEPNRVITVVGNGEYWDKDSLKLNGISFYPIEDHLTEERTFRAGDLHLTENVPLSKVEVYQEKGWEALQIDDYLGSYYYRLNTTRPPFDDALVRRAFSMAIDRKTLVEKVVKAGRRPAYSYVPAIGGYTCSVGVPYDVEGARKLLAEAGYPNGEGLPEVELLYNTSENHKQIAEAVQQMWNKNLNARVALLNQDWKVYLSSLNNLDYNIGRSGWIGDYNDPYGFLECFLTGNGNNRTGYSSEKYDDLLRRACATVATDQRMALLGEAESLLLQDAPVVPVYFYTRVYLKSPDVHGWQSNQLGYIAWKNLYLAAAGD